MRAADPAVIIRTTDYFNHSFAPDLVLSWPREDRERLVYVRLSASPDWLLDDLQTVARHHPLVFTLEDIGGPDELVTGQKTVLTNSA